MIGPDKESLVGGARSISLDVVGSGGDPQRPHNVRHITAPAYETPLRHHQRKPSTPRQVKETLHARSEWSNSGDDGTAVHRINQYVIREEIGRGSFGSVHLAVDQYGNEYAVKEFSKSRLRKRAQSHILRRPHGRAGRTFSPGAFGNRLSAHPSSDGSNDNPLFLIREEIAIMKKLNHQNLVSLLEVLDDPEEDSLYMVLEMCKKGVIMKVGMHEPADPYDDESCRCWFRDLILGIEYLHAQGVAHRDIKPDNLLLTEDDELKIVDFGVSEMFEKSSDSLSMKSAGSPAFLPPELCVTKHGTISGKAADIWSMGVTLYCLAFGHVPFEKTNILELYRSISDDPVAVKDDVDPEFKDIIYRLLEKDPEKRIKMEELREHPWVTRSGADPLMSSEENVTNVVEPPTAEEVDRAITKNMGNLLAVVKAVKQFKRLLYRRRPSLFEGILGSSARVVQPPLQIDQLEQPSKSKLHLQTRSQDAHDRRPVEGALATEGVHKDTNRDIEMQTDEREDGAVVMSPNTARAPSFPHAGERPSPQPHPQPSHGSFPNTGPPLTHSQSHPLTHSQSYTQNHPPHHHRTGTAHSGKGQAHDPLTDTIFLGIGASGSDSYSPTNANVFSPGGSYITPAISESPSADDTNIYEKAYEQEVERIRRERGRHATLYLTRRVEGIKEQIEGEWAGVKAKSMAKSATLPLASGEGVNAGVLRGLVGRAAEMNRERNMVDQGKGEDVGGPSSGLWSKSVGGSGQKLAGFANLAREGGQAGQQSMANAAEALKGLKGRVMGTGSGSSEDKS